ncbi:hypothetical protein KGQ19_26760 [Catenulispora sp. NL8]|uniref:Uncharacterized protein n=1 Tax=Catenulispora pinistramenti TaxID=2705254 RepID=A0ABS5KWM7_9ACTN|nr:hypothetical protein [Catenulispora pinistramenti]MBS2550477.1 hypothetical protein [Catenulispora pinistramenti]
MRDPETERNNLTEKLSAARDNLRFADKRHAALEVEIVEPRLVIPDAAKAPK